MKLAQLLAKELKEWPEGVTHLTQSEVDYEIYDGLDGNKEDSVAPLDERFYASMSHSEGQYPMVTRAQWQAEREKMNKPKWIRHRGGKCPVADDVKVLYRMRSGTITSRGEPSSILSWDHSKSGADIMAYRVIEETKDQEIEEVKKTNFGTITYKLEIDAAEATKEIDSLVAKWGQLESPLKWRDAIIHCQAIIEDCEREIQRNVNLLDAEGLMMQKDSKKATQYYQTDIDMSDWRNWQIGDRVCATKNFDDADIGDELIITRLDHADEEQPIGMSTGSSATYWPEMNWVKFVRRP